MQLNEIGELFNRMDRAVSLPEKLESLVSWTEKLGLSEDCFAVYRSPGDKIVPSKQALAVNPDIISILPATPGLIDINLIRYALPVPDYQGSRFFLPFNYHDGSAAGGLFLTGDVAKRFTEDKAAVSIIQSKLSDVVELNSLRHLNARTASALHAEGISKIISLFNLPFYLCDESGTITYANHLFLESLGYSEHDVFENGGGISIERLFRSTQDRYHELDLARKQGLVSRYTHDLTAGNGKHITVWDFLVKIDDGFLGVVVDVSDLTLLTEDLQDALKMQENLNDRLITSSLILQKTQTAAIRSLARLAEYRDHETGSHLQRICEYSGAIAAQVYRRQPFSFGVSETYVSDMYLSSMLHDIGKVGVPDQILLKPGSLSNMERDIMEQHTTWGWNILSQADVELGERSYLTLATKIALYHHERYDGTGYPHRKKGSEIPLSARIESIADVYDALTSKRPYKEAWTHEEAMKEIKLQAGKQFDPVLVEIACEIESELQSVRHSLVD